MWDVFEEPIALAWIEVLAWSEAAVCRKLKQPELSWRTNASNAEMRARYPPKMKEEDTGKCDRRKAALDIAILSDNLRA